MQSKLHSGLEIDGSEMGGEWLDHILIDAMRDGALTLSPQGAILYSNRRFAEMLNRMPEQVLGKPLLDFVVPADRERLRHLLEHASEESTQAQVAFLSAQQKRVFTQISLRAWSRDETRYLALVVTDISERKRAEKRSIYQAHLLANVHDAIVSTDVQHAITFWNRAAEEMYGWPAEEVLGRNCQQVLGSEWNAAERDEFFKQLDETGHVQHQVVQHRKDGTRLYVSARGITLRAKDRQVVGYVLVNQDLTERKRAEEALLERSRLLELTHDAMFVRDMEGRITFWNTGAAEMYGWTKEEALGHIARELFQSQYPEPIEEIEARVILEGHWEGELVHTTHNGQTLVVASRWALERDADGRPLAILETNTDITHRTQAEEELRASEQRFRLAVDNFPGVFIIYDAERRIQFINTPGLVLNGVPEQQLLGHTDEEIFPPEVTAPYLPLLHRAVETGTVQSGEVNVTLAAGTFAEKVTYVPLLDEYGEIQQILGIMEDITERQQAEEEIRRLNLELEQRVVERTAELEAANRALVGEMAEHARADEALRQSEARFRLLAENAQDWIYRMRLVPEFRVEYMSPSTTRIFGHAPEEFYADSTLLFQLIYPEDLEALETLTRGDLMSEQLRTLRWIRSDGARIWIEHRNVFVYDEEGQPVAVEGIAREMTERQEAEEALQQANMNLTNWARELEQRNWEMSLLNEMGDLLQSCLTVEETYRVIAGSARRLFPEDLGALYMLNESRTLLEQVVAWSEPQPERLEHVFAPDDCWALRRGRMHVVEDAQTGLVCRHLNPGSGVVAAGYVCLPMVAQGETLGLFYLQSGTREPLSESKLRLSVSVAEHVALAVSSLRLRETLRSQAIRDSLTGLFNRRYMEESLERELRRAARKKAQVGIIMLDLDHFKNFNDSYGHTVGDLILRAFGQFLQSHIREGDVACRYGGEEFTLILPETAPEEAHTRALEICRGFRDLNVEHDGHEYGHLSVSLGIANFPEHGTSAEELLRAADSALYQAKANGRDQVIIAPGPRDE